MIFFSDFWGNKANSMQTQMPILIVTLFVGTMEVSFNLDLAHMCVPVAMWTSYWISNRFRRIGESLCMILAIYIPLLLSSLILIEFYTASFLPIFGLTKHLFSVIILRNFSLFAWMCNSCLSFWLYNIFRFVGESISLFWST